MSGGTLDPNADTTLKALRQYLGDDLQRAKSFFRNCTPDQMTEPYGARGQTRQQILDKYQEHHDRVTEAIAWFEALCKSLEMQ